MAVGALPSGRTGVTKYFSAFVGSNSTITVEHTESRVAAFLTRDGTRGPEEWAPHPNSARVGGTVCVVRWSGL